MPKQIVLMKFKWYLDISIQSEISPEDDVAAKPWQMEIQKKHLNKEGLFNKDYLYKYCNLY